MSTQSIAGLLERLGHCTYGSAYCDGLKPAQWSALRYFDNANQYSKTTSAFACYQGSTLGAASQTITSLVDKKLLKKIPDKSDGRKHFLRLTPAAKKLIAQDPIVSLLDAVSELDPYEQDNLKDCLEKLVRQLARGSGARRFGYCDDCRFLRPGSGAAGHKICAVMHEELSEEELGKLCVNYNHSDAN